MNLLITEIFENIKNDINIYENIDFINISVFHVFVITPDALKNLLVFC